MRGMVMITLEKTSKICALFISLIILPLISGCLDNEDHHSLTVTFVYYSDDYPCNDTTSIDQILNGELFWNTTLMIDGNVVFSDEHQLVYFSAHEWQDAGSFEFDSNNHLIEATCKETELTNEIEVLIEEDMFMLVEFYFSEINIKTNNEGFIKA